MTTNSPSPAASPEGLGQLLGDYPDVRGEPAQIVGMMLGVAGAAILVAGFVPDWELLRVLGVVFLVVGLPVLGLGKWRSSNRVLVFTGGLIHNKRGTVECHLWRDLLGIGLEREKSEQGVGLVPMVSFHMGCHLQRRDGSWIQVNIPPVSVEAMKAIKASWEAFTKVKLAAWSDGHFNL